MGYLSAKERKNARTEGPFQGPLFHVLPFFTLKLERRGDGAGDHDDGDEGIGDDHQNFFDVAAAQPDPGHFREFGQMEHTPLEVLIKIFCVPMTSCSIEMELLTGHDG
jgi:hypothetical protein